MVARDAISFSNASFSFLNTIVGLLLDNLAESITKQNTKGTYIRLLR